MWTAYKAIRQFVTFLFWQLLYTRLGQWLSMKVSGGWCYIRKDDPKFFVAQEHVFCKYGGDPKATPDRGIFTQRNKWTKWVFAKGKTFLPVKEQNYTWHLAIDTHDGKRLACLGTHLPNYGHIRFRVGHESGMAHAISTFAPFQLSFIKEWRSDEGTESDDTHDLLSFSTVL